MQLFYIPDFSGTEILLDEKESKHAIKVLRLGKGDTLNFTDGKGKLYTAEIKEPNSKHCRLNVIDILSESVKRSYEIHVAIAPTKNTDRLEWFLEKATEIGIDKISLILCENSERKVVKIERLEKILISAMKQSMNLYLPKLNPLVSFTEFIDNNNSTCKYIAHCYENEKPHLMKALNGGENTVVLIGPEGDFTLDEISEARAKGYKEISLGNTRLRTETAGVVACHVINLVDT